MELDQINLQRSAKSKLRRTSPRAKSHKHNWENEAWICESDLPRRTLHLGRQYFNQKVHSNQGIVYQYQILLVLLYSNCSQNNEVRLGENSLGITPSILRSAPRILQTPMLSMLVQPTPSFIVFQNFSSTLTLLLILQKHEFVSSPTTKISFPQPI